MCVKSSLWNIGLFHYDMMVSGTKIKFAKELGTMEFIQEIMNDQGREFVFDSQLIEH